jgi:hypothetical protein
MHVFVDFETVKRAVVTKLGVSEWDVVSQGRPVRGSMTGGRPASPRPSPARPLTREHDASAAPASRHWRLR